MNDQLERDIRNLFCNTGELSRDEVTSILLGLLERIQHLEQLRPAQEPVAWMLEWAFNGEERGYRLYDDERHCVFDAESDGGVCRPLYTSPPAQRKPLHIGEETAAFKAWFDAWWIGDGEQGETIPTQSDKYFLTYLDQYTLGFGAWMAAKHAAHGIKENT